MGVQIQGIKSFPVRRRRKERQNHFPGSLYSISVSLRSGHPHPHPFSRGRQARIQVIVDMQSIGKFIIRQPLRVDRWRKPNNDTGIGLLRLLDFYRKHSVHTWTSFDSWKEEGVPDAPKETICGFSTGKSIEGKGFAFDTWTFQRYVCEGTLSRALNLTELLFPLPVTLWTIFGEWCWWRVFEMNTMKRWEIRDGQWEWMEK